MGLNKNNKLVFGNRFVDLTIIIPAMDETYSLRETVNIIMSKNNKEYINQILIVLSENRGSLACKDVAQDLHKQYEEVTCLFQKRPFAGGALQDGFDVANGSHIVMMSADLETDPHLISSMIEQSLSYPDKIITVSRWIRGGGFHGYNRIKLYLNFIFQKIIAIMFWSKLTDITYAYRLFPSNLIKLIDWKELKHPMFLETAIVPLRLGTKFIEIPGKWEVRTEGISNNSFLSNFKYFKTALRVRFSIKNKLIKQKL